MPNTLSQLTQQEADAFLSEEKYRIDNTIHIFPEDGGALHIPLRTKDSQNELILDIRRSNIELKKILSRRD